MLFDIKDSILNINLEAHVSIYGQEVNAQTIAICKSSLYMKSPDVPDADNIRLGNTLSLDLFGEKKFDYILSNPPYGKSWKTEQQIVMSEHILGFAGRFGAGLPRISDSQLLFLQHIIAHMKRREDGGSRLVVLVNDSTLFSGDAGSGESEIRRWIIENDWLEAIISLPEQLFFNTSIATYLLMLTNRKTNSQRGRVQLINATGLWATAQKSIGSKRRIISHDNIKRITDLYYEFGESEYSKLVVNEDFGYRRIVIERPLRLNFQASEERFAHLQRQRIVHALSRDKKNKALTIPPGYADEEAYASAILDMLHTLSNILYKDRAVFNQLLQDRARAAKIILGPSLTKTILDALSERDETAETCFDREGKPEPDPKLRETQNISLDQDFWTYFVHQVRNREPDAWVNIDVRDQKDGRVGRVGYEANYNIYSSLVADYELQELTKHLGLEPSTLSEITTEINFVQVTKSSKFEERPNSVYLPLTGLSEVITTLSQATLEHLSSYAQIILDPDKAVALYVAGFFNRKVGKLLRKQIMTRTTLPRIISKEIIPQLKIYLPDRATQVKTIETDTKVTNFISELATIQDRIWSQPNHLNHALDEIQKLNREEGFYTWLDTLPFPLASILWMYFTARGNPQKQYEHLLHFFEAFAEFLATLLLSGFATDNTIFPSVRQQLQKSLRKDSLRRATFGTWVIMVQCLAKRGESLLNDSTESQILCETLFRTRNQKLLEMLFSDDLIFLLKETNVYRNEWIGHGGIVNMRDASDRRTVLENCLSKLRAIFSNYWEQYTLIKAGESRYNSGVYHYNIEKTVGCRTPFEKKKVETDIPMDDGQLYLLASNERKPLKLLPFIKVMPSPRTSQNACYFYNSFRIGKIRFVSYHFEEEPEIIDAFEDIAQVLQIITL